MISGKIIVTYNLSLIFRECYLSAKFVYITVLYYLYAKKNNRCMTIGIHQIEPLRKSIKERVLAFVVFFLLSLIPLRLKSNSVLNIHIKFKKSQHNIVSYLWKCCECADKHKCLNKTLKMITYFICNDNLKSTLFNKSWRVKIAWPSCFICSDTILILFHGEAEYPFIVTFQLFFYFPCLRVRYSSELSWLRETCITPKSFDDSNTHNPSLI